MEYTFTLEALPIVGGVLIVLVLLICEIGSAGFGTGLPSGHPGNIFFNARHLLCTRGRGRGNPKFRKCRWLLGD